MENPASVLFQSDYQKHGVCSESVLCGCFELDVLHWCDSSAVCAGKCCRWRTDNSRDGSCRDGDVPLVGVPVDSTSRALGRLNCV